MKNIDEFLSDFIALSAIAFTEKEKVEKSQTEKDTTEKSCTENQCHCAKKYFTQTPEISDLMRQIKHDIFKCQNVTMFNISQNEPSKRKILNLLDKITENLMKLDERL
ncbi:MAG: hypothetical protein K2J08_01970 [Ruminococcus sp.]|nr:hypothetical protein [Ruminococcus sp.]